MQKNETPYDKCEADNDTVFKTEACLRSFWKVLSWFFLCNLI